jgi:tetratricopeptide (TPR) repeat protein
MIFEHLERDDGAEWRAALQQCDAEGLDAAIAEARQVLASGTDAVDTLASIAAAAHIHGRFEVRDGVVQELLAALRSTCGDGPSYVAAVFELAGDVATGVGYSPRTGRFVRHLQAALQGVGMRAEELATAAEQRSEADDFAPQRKYVLARLRLREAWQSGDREALAKEALWQAVRPFLSSTPWPAHTLRLLVRLATHLDERDCHDVERLHEVARALSSFGFARPALVVMTRVVVHHQRHGEPTLKLSVAMTDLAAVHRANGEDGAAEKLLRTSIDLARRLGGPEHAQVHVSESHLAGLLVDGGRFDEALALLEALLPRRLARGRATEGTYVTHIRLSQAYLGVGRAADAEQSARAAVGIAQEARLMSWEARDALADALDALGRSVEAEQVRDWSTARELMGLVC